MRVMLKPHVDAACTMNGLLPAADEAAACGLPAGGCGTWRGCIGVAQGDGFPAFGDAQWGTWAGAFFGVYFGHHGVEGAVLKVGDVIEVETWTRWDAHLKSSSALLAFLRNSVALQLVLAVAAMLARRSPPLLQHRLGTKEAVCAGVGYVTSVARRDRSSY